MYASHVSQGHKKGPTASSTNTEVSYNSPAPPTSTTGSKREGAGSNFRRNTATSLLSSSLNNTSDHANMDRSFSSPAAKLLHSSLSTYSSVDDDNEQALQSYLSTDSEDPTLSSLGYGATASLRAREGAGTESTMSSLCVVENFTEANTATTASRAEDYRSNHSTSVSTHHSSRDARATKSGPRGATTTAKANDYNLNFLGPQTARKLSGRSAERTPSRSSSSRVSFSQRLSKDIERSRELEAELAASIKPEPTLYAYEEVAPVALECGGVRCCPLLRRCVSKRAQAGVPLTAEKEGDINLSPFKTWDFTRFLPQDNEVTPSVIKSAAQPRQKNTLCLDLDETLVHTSLVHMADADAVVKVCPTKADGDGTYDLYVKYRPYLREFLQFSLANFEVVIFTASKKYYARAILARLQTDFNDMFSFYAPDDEETSNAKQRADIEDKKRSGNCMILLHRDHCTPTNAGYVKDLFLLGRDLRRCFIIDNNVCCGSFQPYNFLHVKDFARVEKEVRGTTSVEEAPAETVNNHGMDQAKLKELKGFQPAASGRKSLVSCESTYLWEDPDDQVLLSLISENHAILRRGRESQHSGLLQGLAVTDDVPKYLLESMLRSKRRMDAAAHLA